MAVDCEKVVNDLFADWTKLNLDGIMGHFAENAVWDNIPMNAPAKGRSAIREMTEGFLKDTASFSVKVVKCAAMGNLLLNERVDTIKMKNGKSAAIPVAGVFEFNDAGKITAWRDYFDLATFTKQTS